MSDRAHSGAFPGLRPLAATVAIVGAAILACATPKVDVEYQPGADLSRYASVSVDLDGSKISRDDGQGPDFEADLLDQAREILIEKGHEVLPRDQAELRIVIEPKSDTVLLRTWSSEPENNSIEEVAHDAAVVRVRAIDASAEQEVWYSEARSRLPRVHVPFTPSRTKIWSSTLAAALEDFDSRRD